MPTLIFENAGGRPAVLSPHPLAAKYNENCAFCHEAATMSGYDRSLFQSLTKKIRYLADQRNFSTDQRIKAALSIEKQWNPCSP
jgi:hypothetical protein